MSLKQFLRTMWARRWISLIAALACVAAGALTVLILPKRYVAESRVMVTAADIDPISGAQVGLVTSRAYIPTQTELISDYRVSGRVVDQLGWMKMPAVQKSYRDSGEARLDMRRWLAAGISANTSAKAIDNTNIIAISYEASDPDEAARMADAVRDAYISESLDYKRSTAAKNAKWYDQQAKSLQEQLSVAEKRKADFERETGIILLEDGTDADSAQLQSVASAFDTPTTQTVGGGGNPNAAQIAALDARIATASQSLGPNHPEIQALQQQRAALASAGSSSAVRTVTSGPSIASQTAAARARVLANRGNLEQARKLWADVMVLREQYGEVVKTGAALQQTSASENAGVVPVGNAVAPTKPSSPKIPQILIGSTVLGLLLGLMLGLVSELMRRRVRGFDDLEGLGVPLIGVINAKSLPALAG